MTPYHHHHHHHHHLHRLHHQVLLAVATSLLLLYSQNSLTHAQSQYEVNQVLSQFSVVGEIQSLTVDDPLDVLSSGKIKVNGITVLIPSNLVVLFPAAYWTLAQIVKMGPAPGSSGLALQDAVRNPGVYMVEIVGNIVRDSPIDSLSPARYIAGEVKISPDAGLQTAQGFIRSIDYTTGELCVGADKAANAGACKSPDARVRLIDPSGRYGKRQARDDARFAVDPDNPTVTSMTGYPMCIPRISPALAIDALCPIGNRPKDYVGAWLTTFVMNGPNLAAQFLPGLTTPFVSSCNNAPYFQSNPTNETICNPEQQAPLVPGDYITYAGILTRDGAIGAYSIKASVGIYTQQGAGNTAYIAIEELTIGTGPVACEVQPNVACALEAIITGVTTDPSRANLVANRINFYYVDVNLTSGDKFPRLVVEPAILNSIIEPMVEASGLFGGFKFTLRPRTFGAQVPPTSGGLFGTGGLTREILLSIDDFDPLDPSLPVPNPDDNPERVRANGIIAGQYWAPVSEYVFAEPATAGIGLPQANFNCLSHLVAGWNLDLYGNGTNVAIPPIWPWPGNVLGFAAGVNCDTFF